MLCCTVTVVTVARDAVESVASPRVTARHDALLKPFLADRVGIVTEKDTWPDLAPAKYQCISVVCMLALKISVHLYPLQLHERGILYAPDYVINAGGIINVGVEMTENGYDEGVALEWISRIYGNLKRVFEISREEGVPTNKAALQLAQARIDAGRR